MPRPLPVFSQSDYLIQAVDINSHTEWQTVQIQKSWLLQKPTDLDLHCLQRQGISALSRTRVKILIYIRNRAKGVCNCWLGDEWKTKPWYGTCRVFPNSDFGRFYPENHALDLQKLRHEYQMMQRWSIKNLFIYCSVFKSICHLVKTDYHAKLWLSWYYHNKRNPYHNTITIKGLTSRCITIL